MSAERSACDRELRSEENDVVDEVTAVFLDEHQLCDKFIVGPGAPLFPDDGDGVVATEDCDELASSESSPGFLVSRAHRGQVFRSHDSLESVGEVADMHRVVDPGRGLHQVVHDRVYDRQDFGVTSTREFHPPPDNNSAWILAPTAVCRGM